MWSVECGVWSVEGGVWSVECGVWRVELRLAALLLAKQLLQGDWREAGRLKEVQEKVSGWVAVAQVGVEVGQMVEKVAEVLHPEDYTLEEVGGGAGGEGGAGAGGAGGAPGLAGEHGADRQHEAPADLQAAPARAPRVHRGRQGLPVPGREWRPFVEGPWPGVRARRGLGPGGARGADGRLPRLLQVHHTALNIPHRPFLNKWSS